MLFARNATVKKTLSLFLTAFMLVISSTGCGGSRQSASPSPSAGTMTIVDMAGREVEIPKHVERVALIYGVTTSYIVALGKADTLAAATSPSEIFKSAHPVFANLGTIGRNGGGVDMEALAQLKPDIFFHRASNVSLLNSVQTMGIPAVGVTAENQGDITTLLSLLGRIFGAEERAAELTTCYGQILDKARELSRDIPPEKRKKAIFMGTRIGAVANGAMMQSFMIDTAGGINLAKDVPSTEIWPVVGTETIFGWDPDFIFISNYVTSNYNVETLTSDPAWADLTAVKEKQVFRLPSDKDSWELPGVSSALGPLWMLSTMYPDKFDRKQLDAEVREFYKKVYNLDVTPELLGY